MTEQERVDPQLQDFILAETQKQRFQVIIINKWIYFHYIISVLLIGTYIV